MAWHKRTSTALSVSVLHYQIPRHPNREINYNHHTVPPSTSKAPGMVQPALTIYQICERLTGRRARQKDALRAPNKRRRRRPPRAWRLTGGVLTRAAPAPSPLGPTPSIRSAIRYQDVQSQTARRSASSQRRITLTRCFEEHRSQV